MNQEKAEELWDEISQILPSDIDELQFFVGRNICLQEDFIKAVTTTQEDNGWISVERDSPDYDGDYLCAVIEIEPCGTKYIRKKVIQCLFNNWVVNHNQIVTHWQPLPLPPNTKP